MSTSESDYKYALKCIYNAHDADVRVIKASAFPENGIITGSRDSLVKVWIPEEDGFRESYIFSGATKYIASLCVLPSSSQYPNGLILAGSNDCAIYGFTPESMEPVLRLLGHSGSVCSLSAGKFGYIISGSWDKTARVWSGQQCILTLRGHQEAVWATEVFPEQNLMLTGSADKTVRLWQFGVCEKVFSGHEDCVRGLAVISEVKFLSCGNDSTVRAWLISGECLEVYKSHTDYIYSITLLKNGTDFSTCGEDQNIKIWKNGLCVQTIVLSSKTLWCITCLSNGDLAVGTCDGKVYVFEIVPFDYFETMSSSLKNTSDINSDTSKSDTNRKNAVGGETVIFHELENDYMYVCNYENSRNVSIKKDILNFQVINDTLCKITSDTRSEKKTDYEFDVDVENTRYKLAFNKWENPWDVANKFVASYNLHPEHVGQIVDYILKNQKPTVSNEYVPAQNFLSYWNINITGLRAKLLEFCAIVPKEQSITEEEVDELLLLAYDPEEISPDQMTSLDKVISWNDELLFPVLDLLRVAVKCKALQVKIGTKDFVNHILLIFRNTQKTVNRILIEKIFCNMFGIDETKEVLTNYQVKIFELIREVFSEGEESVQKAGSALFLNFAVASFRGFSLNLNEYCVNVVKLLNYVTDSEAIFRVLVAIGTICVQNSSAVAYLRASNADQLLVKFASSNDLKITRVVSLLLTELALLTQKELAFFTQKNI